MCLLGGTGVVHSNNARLRGVECRQPGFDGGGVGVGGWRPGYSCHGYRVAMETSPGHTALYSLAVCARAGALQLARRTKELQRHFFNEPTTVYENTYSDSFNPFAMILYRLFIQDLQSCLILIVIIYFYEVIIY